MYTLFKIVICATFITGLLAYPQGSQKQPTSRYSSHKNFNLLPRRGKCGIQGLQDKVLGGNATSIDEFPWMALLEYKKNGESRGFQCGGALINDRYVITAAHCVTGRDSARHGEVFSIRLGEHDLDKAEDCVVYDEDDEVCSDPPINIEVEEIIPHASYKPSTRTKFYDIALIRLKTPVTFSPYVTPICLPTNGEKSREGEILTVAGWGVTSVNGTKSNIKIKADIPVVSNSECTLVYLTQVVIDETQLCVGGQKGIDSCNGDSGSPIMRCFPNETDFYLEGVVSFGIAQCGSKNVPGVYTRVDKYIDWILDNMKP